MANPASQSRAPMEPANFNPAPDALREPTNGDDERRPDGLAYCHARRARAAHHRGSDSRGGWPRSPGVSRWRRAVAQRRARARASSSLQFARPRRAAAPRRSGQPRQRGARAAEIDRSGNGRCAARHCRLRISRSQSIRCASVRCVVLGVSRVHAVPREAGVWINPRARGRG